MWKILLHIQIILMVLGFVSTSPDNAPGKIIGGTIVDIKDYPYQVSLRIAVHNRVFRCGGSILNERFILTTASCTKKHVTSAMEVRVGSSFENKDGDVRYVKSVHNHPKYSVTTNSYDISILKLSSRIAFNSTAQPINLPTADSEIVDGMNATATGWELTKTGRFYGSDHLQMVTLSTISTKKCKKRYYNWLLNSQFCAGYVEKSACAGDPGGPLVVSGVQIGVASLAPKGKPGTFTEVALVRNWIDEIIKS